MDTFKELYSDSKYEKPSLTVDIIAFRVQDRANKNYRKLNDKVLQVFLKNREYSPFENFWSIPGTFIDMSLPLEDTVHKCIEKKIGKFPYYFEQLYSFGNVDRDPRTRVVSIAYLVLTNTTQTFEGGQWFDIDIKKEQIKRTDTEDGYILNEKVLISLTHGDISLDGELQVVIEKRGLEEIKRIELVSNPLAFDHIKFIFHAIERMRNKIEYTDIVFNLLPPLFTLTELKNIFEIVLGVDLLDANFRRKISRLVTRTENFSEPKGHRISQLYKFNPNWNGYTME